MPPCVYIGFSSRAFASCQFLFAMDEGKSFCSESELDHLTNSVPHVVPHSSTPERRPVAGRTKVGGG